MVIVVKTNSGPTLHRDWIERTAWIFETMGTQMPARKKEKEEMKKIAYVFLQKSSKFQTKKICFKDPNRIRMPTIYISIHMHILL
jgi:hypothetical protein